MKCGGFGFVNWICANFYLICFALPVFFFACWLCGMDYEMFADPPLAYEVVLIFVFISAVFWNYPILSVEWLSIHLGLSIDQFGNDPAGRKKAIVRRIYWLVGSGVGASVLLYLIPRKLPEDTRFLIQVIAGAWITVLYSVVIAVGLVLLAIKGKPKWPEIA